MLSAAGVFVAFHVSQLNGAEVGALLLGCGEVGGVDEARVGVTGGDLGCYVGDLAFGGCVLEGDVVLLQFLVGDGAAGNVFLADCDDAFGGLEVVEAVDLTGVTFGGDEHELVGDQNVGFGAENWSSFFALSMFLVSAVMSRSGVAPCSIWLTSFAEPS